MAITRRVNWELFSSLGGSSVERLRPRGLYFRERCSEGTEFVFGRCYRFGRDGKQATEIARKAEFGSSFCEIMLRVFLRDVRQQVFLEGKGCGRLDVDWLPVEFRGDAARIRQRVVVLPGTAETLVMRTEAAAVATASIVRKPRPPCRCPETYPQTRPAVARSAGPTTRA